MATKDFTFQPLAGKGVAFNASTATGNQAILSATDLANYSGALSTVRVSIPAADKDVWIAFGIDNTITASASTDLHLPAGSVETFYVPVAYNYIAAITATGTAHVYVMRSSGF